MSQIVATHSAIPLVARRRQPSAVVARLTLLFGWLERARSRRQLAELDDRMLADIGIDRATAQSEADRPFWRESIPAGRRDLLADARRPLWYVR